MSEFRLPKSTHIGYVHLRVQNLQQTLRFYKDVLGFHPVEGEQWDDRKIALSSTGAYPVCLILEEQPDAQPKPRGTTGLFHLAIRFPSRYELARVFHRLVEQRWPIAGFSDHRVSEAIYLADAEGNGVELYADRPRAEWPRQGDDIAMTTEILDVEGLLGLVVDDPTPWSGIHPETDIGHLHIQVADLERAERFYHSTLGFDITQRDYPGARFLSAGGYHHHIGLNVWAGVGAPNPPADAVGLVSFSLQLPDEGALTALEVWLEDSGVTIETGLNGRGGRVIGLLDPDGNKVILRA